MRHALIISLKFQLNSLKLVVAKNSCLVIGTCIIIFKNDKQKEMNKFELPINAIRSKKERRHICLFKTLHSFFLATFPCNFNDTGKKINEVYRL